MRFIEKINNFTPLLLLLQPNIVATDGQRSSGTHFPGTNEICYSKRFRILEYKNNNIIMARSEPIREN